MIEVRELRKTYAGGIEAVRGIDFDVATGEVFGLLGPNGAGKSTTIGMLTTTIEPSGGTALVGGFDVVRQPLPARRVRSVVLRAALGRELLELKVDGNAAAALASLRARGIAHDDAFLVGSTVTVPLNGHGSADAIAVVKELRLAAAVTSRPPTLDDVYLRLTGGRLAEAA